MLAEHSSQISKTGVFIATQPTRSSRTGLIRIQHSNSLESHHKMMIHVTAYLNLETCIKRAHLISLQTKMDTKTWKTLFNPSLSL